MAPAPGQVLRHARVDLFFGRTEDEAPSSPFQPPAQGGSGARWYLEHLPRVRRAQPRSLLPAGVVFGTVLATIGTDPSEGAGLLSPPRAGRAAPFPAIRLLAIYRVIRKVVLSQGCFPGAGGTGCWVFCSSPGQSKRVAQRCPASPQHHCISNPASPPSAPHDRRGERGASINRAKMCPLLPIRRLQSNGRVFQCPL